MKRKINYVAIALILASILALQIQPTFAKNPNKTYVPKDLGTLPGGTYAIACDINNRGDIVGAGNDENLKYSYFLLPHNEAMVDLNIRPYSTFIKINERGEIAGTYLDTTNNPNGYPTAFRWTEKDGMQDLGTLPGGKWSFAMDINDNGEIVGYSDRQTGYFHGFVWSEKTGMTDIGALSDPGVSFAMAINNKGQVVGMGRLSGMYQPMILWTEQEGLEMIGTFPGENYASPVAINEQGQAVGSAADGSTFSAFMYSNKIGFLRIGDLPGGDKSTAVGINNNGIVVGYSFFSDSSNPDKKVQGFIWTDKEGLSPLQSLSSDTTNLALAINEPGQIVGWSSHSNADGTVKTHAVIWELE
ncbi:MAG: hypothetical protein A2Y79_09185 [Deltaproteobacteria bacterium RBG_13_43_22]|nr:MAG: hypothetical protein A2Y79_09185 [Deltaproteobacteria bacterium RBG_13_43_22]